MENCGKCGSMEISINQDKRGIWIACDDCGYAGPVRQKLARAIIAWDREVKHVLRKIPRYHQRGNLSETSSRGNAAT